MAQSLANVLVHFVFSTKDRQPWIIEEFQPDAAAYIAGLFRNHDCPVLIVNAMPDHVHSLAALSRTHSISDIMEADSVAPAGLPNENPEPMIESPFTQGSLRFTLGYQRPALRASQLAMECLPLGLHGRPWGPPVSPWGSFLLTTGNLPLEPHGRHCGLLEIKQLIQLIGVVGRLNLHRRRDCDSVAGVA